MPRKKPSPKYKGKSHDFLEDFIEDSEAAEILSETYDDRTLAWKKIKLEEKQALDKWKQEYIKLRVEQLRQEEEGKGEMERMNYKMSWLLHQTLTPEAYEWLDSLREYDHETCNIIVRQIIDDDAMAAIDNIIAVIYQSGGTPMKDRINLYDLVNVWRKIKGVKSKIQVKGRDGEMIDLSDYVRESKDWREEDE